MNQERYVIFTTEENQGLETFLGSGEKAKCVVLGYTPEQIARKMKFLGISANDDIYYSSGMEFGKEVGFKTDYAPIELFEASCKVYLSNLETVQELSNVWIRSLFRFEFISVQYNFIIDKGELMEILFYVGMIIFGFYCLVTEDIEKVKKDFGVK